jgi:hypothetical protein
MFDASLLSDWWKCRAAMHVHYTHKYQAMGLALSVSPLFICAAWRVDEWWVGVFVAR